MRRLFDVVVQARLLAQKDEQIASLRAELKAARDENQRMRAGMRHCTTCEYRSEVRSKRTEHKLLGGTESSGDDSK